MPCRGNCFCMFSKWRWCLWIPLWNPGYLAALLPWLSADFERICNLVGYLFYFHTIRAKTMPSEASTHTHFLSGVFKTLGLHTFSRHNDLEEMVSLKGTNVHNIFTTAFFLSPWTPHLSKNVHFRSLFGEAVSGGGGTSSEPVCSCSQRFLRYSQVTFRPHDLTWSIFLYQL